MSAAVTTPAAAPAAPVKTTPAEDDSNSDEGAAIDTFCEYQPSGLPSAVIALCNSNDNGTALTVPSHTSTACESSLLSSATVPLIHPDTAASIQPLLQERKLSPLQVEGVLLAIQRHQRVFRNGERAGFFLGDGAGIGKGRQIAALIRDSLSRKTTTKRHLWLSVSRELINDARRDLTDIGVHCEVHDGTQLLCNKGAGLGKANKGVMFLTYNLLVSKNRLEQIIEWCADASLKRKNKTVDEASFSGCIVYDEAHKAKNLANDTKTAQLVLELQRRLPNARVLYCSATGVSDVAHLAYAERLGLWNTSPIITNSISQFQDFNAFHQSLSRGGGLGSLELLALELKQQGSFLARTLSWEGAEFETTQIPLTTEQQQTYDRAVGWWTTVQNHLTVAIEKTKASTNTWRNFWSAHQRFFKELAIAAKIPFVAQDALQHVQKHNRCVVIGLQSTGDASMQSLFETHFKGKRLEDEKFPALLSTCSAVLTQLIENHFPIKPTPPEMPKLPKTPSAEASNEEQQRYAYAKAEIARLEALPPPEPIPELEDMKQTLLDTISSLGLPPNPLDDLIDKLGGPNAVAEMTGRATRMVRPSGKDYFVYTKRASSEDSDRINLVERRKFMNGNKPFAIISDAASTGISLHAARGSASSHKRRVHMTIELPWSADKAVQQLGRTHRSAQESAPIYKLVVTTLGGESRFAAAVSKRMASLGALTKGDRRAATGSDLSDFDLDSKYGKRALKRFYWALSNNEVHRVGQQSEQGTLPTACLPSQNTKQILDGFVGKMEETKDSMLSWLPKEAGPKHSAILAWTTEGLDQVGLARDKVDVRVFLNRLAGLTVSRQALVFSLFMSTLGDEIKLAKASGEFEGTAEEIHAASIEVDSEEDLAVDPSCGVPTKLTLLLLDRGISLEAISAMAMAEARKDDKVKAMVAEADEEPQPEETEGEMDDDEWFSSAKAKDRIAEAGFYISRNKIAGRHLVLFAKRKFDQSTFVSEEAAASFDPDGLMVITRPNTGTNWNEMSTRDLERKYRLAVGCDELKELSGAEEAPLAAIKEGYPQVAKMWDEAWNQSNSHKNQDGLAPRLAKVALVTGPVLHVMPALQKAVLMRSEKQKALKIMRAHVATRTVVGVRFPPDHEAIQNLRDELKKLREARKSEGDTFEDEALPPVCNKSLEWATTERKTMKSFFQVTAKATQAASKRAKVVTPTEASTKPTKSNGTKSSGTKRSTSTSKGVTSGSSNKKAKKLTSFFTKTGN